MAQIATKLTAEMPGVSLSLALAQRSMDDLLEGEGSRGGNNGEGMLTELFFMPSALAVWKSARLSAPEWPSW